MNTDTFLADSFATLPVSDKPVQCMACGARFASIAADLDHRNEGGECAPATPVRGPEFPARLAAARKAYFTALDQTKPLPAELAVKLAESMPEKWADMLEKVAAIAATLPALEAAYRELDAVACDRCAGHGEYAGASRRFRNGVKVCFRCNGSGHN